MCENLFEILFYFIIFIFFMGIFGGTNRDLDLIDSFDSSRKKRILIEIEPEDTFSSFSWFYNSEPRTRVSIIQ